MPGTAPGLVKIQEIWMEDNTGLTEELRSLLQGRNALMLAHNYQRDSVQEAADITGDSLGLSQAAAASEAEVIVFCGVHFMAESAAILSPGEDRHTAAAWMPAAPWRI